VVGCDLAAPRGKVVRTFLTNGRVAWVLSGHLAWLYEDGYYAAPEGWRVLQFNPRDWWLGHQGEWHSRRDARGRFTRRPPETRWPRKELPEEPATQWRLFVEEVDQP
jgi:hypothetical protein